MRIALIAILLGGGFFLAGCPGLVVRPTPTYNPTQGFKGKKEDLHRQSETNMVHSPRRTSHEKTRWTPQCDPNTFSDPTKACRFRRGVVLPYPVQRILRGFGKCVRRKRKHKAIDIAGIGKDSGLGTPLRAMVRSKVTFVGRRSENPKKFGRTDKRRGTVIRGRKSLPRSKRIKGYGRVYFFTRNMGSSRTGEFLITEGLEGRFKGYKIRYMHMGAIRKHVKKGTILEAGEEFGLMGGTAIMESSPHVHMDIETPGGRRLDIVPLLGRKSTHEPCR